MKPKLSDLTDASAVALALEEFGRLGRDEFLDRHGFGKSRDFLVLNPSTNELADSKAIAAAALKHQFPELEGLRASDFSGGEATVAPLLERLGYRVVRVGSDWSRREVELIVADYLSMLTRELTGQPYSKAAHRRQLIAQLDGRNDAAVEFKHCNISAVMLEIGFPYLRGYKPRSNFQRGLLMEVVSKQVARHRLIDDATLAAVQRPVESAEVVNFASVLAEAPKREHVAREPEPAGFQAIKRDYLEREAHNRSLGLAGEEFALRFERWRLSQLGANHLAEKVQHVSQTRGDGLGFDILSFESSGKERFIEVKTTSFGQKTPFFVSANEVRFARQNADQFRLYRLFDFRAAPRLFELDGEIEKHCALDASTYRATFG
jgi:hypothetical protein